MTHAAPPPEPAPRRPGRPPAAGAPGSTLVMLFGVAAAVAVGYLFRGLVLPLILAAVVAYFLNPLVTWAQGFAIRRSVAVVGLYASVALLLTLVIFLVGPRLRAESLNLWTNLPALTATLERTIDRVRSEFTEEYPGLRKYLPVQAEPGWLERAVEERIGNVSELLGHVGAIAFVVILVPLFAFFLLRDGGRMLTALIDRLHPVHIETSVAVWCEIDRIIGRYLRGLALDAVIVGCLAAVGLWMIGVPYPLLLGAFTALVNPLPYLGILLSVLGAGVVSLAAGQGIRTLGWIVLIYLLIRVLDDTVILTVTVGGSVHLHPVLVLVSILAGEQALGLLGMVIAVPLVTVVKEIARLLLEHRRNLARPHARVARGRVPVPHYIC